MTTSNGAGRPTVIRGRGGVATSGLVAVVGLFLVGDALVRGDVGVAARTAGVLALVLWVAWVVLLHPSIRIDAAALTVVNVLRRTVVPWGDVDHIGMRHQIVVETRSGHTVRCWGGPTLPRPEPARRGRPAVMPRARELDVLLDALDRHREQDARPTRVGTPRTAQPRAVQPGAVQSDAVQPDAVQPAAARAAAGQPGAGRPGGAQPGSVQPAPVRPGGATARSWDRLALGVGAACVLAAVLAVTVP